MRKNKKKIISILLIILSIISIGVNAYAHSGRTDSSGGHKDNNNKSGLGSYHYHCGGHPAHLHTNGVCPYSSSSSASKSSTSSSSASSAKTTSPVPTTIAVTDIKINENVTSMEEGENKKLTTITTVSTTGEVTAKKYGTVDITATSTNGKTSTIKINIKESPKTENSAIINTSSTNKNNITNTTINSNEDANPLAKIITLGLLGGGGYLGYKKFKKG